MKNTKRLLSILLVMAFVITSVSIGFGDLRVFLKPNSSVGKTDATAYPITFYVPETIYLTPDLTTATVFQKYVDCNTDGTVVASNNDTAGTVYFSS